MLKFFTVQDDENESLLGAITEGKNCIDFNQGIFQSFWVRRMMIPRVCVYVIENS